MTFKELIGKNIKKYRKAAGHTQKELGKKLGYSDSGISAFETGVNEVDMETLQKIADIYGITVDDLLEDAGDPDFSISNLCITEEQLISIFDNIFPCISSDTAIQNSYFATAYRQQKNLYHKMKKGTEVITEDLIKCYDIYADAWNESGIIEAIVNMVGILFGLCSHIVDYDAEKLQQKINLYHKLEARQAKELFDKTKDDIDILNQKKSTFAKHYNFAKIECLRELKKSPIWSSLADYYIAYSYIIGFTDNDNSIAQNRKIGRQLMQDYAELGNSYCIDFFRYAYSLYK